MLRASFLLVHHFENNLSTPVQRKKIPYLAMACQEHLPSEQITTYSLIITWIILQHEVHEFNQNRCCEYDYRSRNLIIMHKACYWYLRKSKSYHFCNAITHFSTLRYRPSQPLMISTAILGASGSQTKMNVQLYIFSHKFL